jgi:hypothetical protein
MKKWAVIVLAQKTLHVDSFDILTSVADLDPVGSGPFWSDLDPNPDV